MVSSSHPQYDMALATVYNTLLKKDCAFTMHMYIYLHIYYTNVEPDTCHRNV